MKTAHLALTVILLAVLIPAVDVKATTSLPEVQGTVYLESGSPASSSQVTITSSTGFLFNTTTTDVNGFYHVTLEITFELTFQIYVNATWGNQTGSSTTSISDGDDLTTLDVSMTGPPRFNITVHPEDINTGDPIASCLIIVSTMPGPPTEIGSGYTNPSGSITFNIAIGTYLFTAIKSGYPTNATAYTITNHDATLTINMGEVPIPNYNLTILVVNESSNLPLAYAGVTVKSLDSSTTVTSGATDTSGYSVFNIPSSQYTITATYDGYLSGESSVDLTADKLVRIALIHGQGSSTPTDILQILAIVIFSCLAVFSIRRMRF